MKRQILILIFSLLVMSAEAQTVYMVYKVSGKVEKYETAGWTVLSKRDNVILKDKLRVTEGSSIGILDCRSMRVYYSGKTGEQTVSSIIHSAQKSSDGIVSQMNRQIKEALDDDKKGITYRISGATHRGQEENDMSEMVYSCLYGILNNGISGNAGNDSGLFFGKVPANDGEFCFSIGNKYDNPLCVNILAISKDGKHKTLCFNVGYSYDEPYMLVPPHSETTVSQFVFAEDEEHETEYVLFATEEPFDSQTLQLLIKNNTSPSDKTDILQKVRFTHLSTL